MGHLNSYVPALRLCSLGLALSLAIACTNSSQDSGDSLVQAIQMDANNQSTDPVLKVSLTDAPHKDFQSVFVNIAKMELFLSKGGVHKRLIIGEGLGPVDLLTLQNGVLLPLASFQAPEGVIVREIRLVLYQQGHYGVEQNGSVCDLQTPSGQTSGVKIKLGTPFTLEKGFEYSLVVDFDAKKSIVVKGNGGCLLKPVIRIPAVTRRVLVPPVEGPEDPPPTEEPGPGPASTDSENPTSEGEEITDGQDTNVEQETPHPYLDENGVPLSPEALGFDPYDPSTYPEGITIEDLYIYF